MRKIKWSVSIGLVGCKRSGVLEVEDFTTDEEIDEFVLDEMWNVVDYNWKEDNAED